MGKGSYRSITRGDSTSRSTGYRRSAVPSTITRSWERASRSRAAGPSSGETVTPGLARSVEPTPTRVTWWPSAAKLRPRSKQRIPGPAILVATTSLATIRTRLTRAR